MFQLLDGSLLYIPNTSRSDISYATTYLSRSMQRPTTGIWKSVNDGLCYLKVAVEMGIYFKKRLEHKIFGYCDSNWGQGRADRSSAAGYIFMFANGRFSRRSKKEDVFAQSTAEAGYIAFLFAVIETLWLRKLNWMVRAVDQISNFFIKKTCQGCTDLSIDNISNDS